METLYVLEPGSYIRKQGNALTVMRENRVKDHIPADGLKKLILVGYVTLSGPVLDYLIKKRVETVFLTPTGRYRSRLTPDEHRHVALRRAQYLSLDNDEYATNTARLIVAGKIANMYRFLLIRSRRTSAKELKIGAAALKALSAKTGQAKDRNMLRGIEGAATRIYFNGFSRLIQNDAFAFNGRNRRPPLDPVNAMLSFVYTMLTNEVQSAIQTIGLDPYLGALHEITYGRPSLACDLVEEYRPFLGDRLVISLINKKMIRTEDFVYRETNQTEYADEKEMKAKRPVEIKPGPLRALISAYETLMSRNVFDPALGKKVSHRWLIRNQARRFGEYLQTHETVYKPFVWEE